MQKSGMFRLASPTASKAIVSLSCILLSLLPPLCAQELNCTVDVVSPQVQDPPAQLVFKNMKDAIYQFMNNTKWTSDYFTQQEKIECSIFIDITQENSMGDWTATMQVQARRPVFKSSYNSPMMNYQDNYIHLIYQLNQPLIFNINTYTDNITSLLAYYAYVILGNDYDSYSLNGGTKYYLDAQTIVNNAQPASEKGWNPQDGTQTRYWLINNILDQTYYAPLRKAIYVYHRLGLDEMYTDLAKGRSEVYDALSLVEQVYDDQPANFNVALFFDAKATEIANIFSEAPNDEKARVMTILNAIDITDMDTYSKLKPTQ